MADRRDDNDEGEDHGDPGDSVRALLSDVEGQAEGLYLADREIEVAELTRAQYAEVTLTARLYAALGSSLRVRLAGDGGPALDGIVEDAGQGWFTLLVRSGSRATTWVVAVSGVVELAGLVDAAVPDTARPAAARLSIRAALRPYAEEGDRVALRLLTGGVRQGRLVRVGADFVELLMEGRGETVVVPLDAVAAVGVET